MAAIRRICNVVIKQKDVYLLVQEGQGPAYKLWNLPGGHVDPGETLEQAAVREALEETGYRVTLGKQLLVFKPAPDTLLHAYGATVAGGELHIPPAEILDAKWFSYEEIMHMENLREPKYIRSAVQAV